MDKYLHVLCGAEEQLWINPSLTPAEAGIAASGLGMEDILEAEARLARFAPLIAALFPETRAAGGIIESPLTELPVLRRELNVSGALYVKRDSELAIAGSVKARGGIYEVLKHTEDILSACGKAELIDIAPDMTEAEIKARISEIRALLSRYTIQAGSTGNLGLSIGIMSAALGYTAIVHMSSDAKAWKKALLRKKGVTVIEYEGDYSAAVARGRELSLADGNSYFVDDENSVELFMGYAVAALRLRRELDRRGITVDAEHPLSVYLPCGVGGAPGGICFGLKAVFGDAVRAYFAEPVQAPCMLAAFLCGEPRAVTELGLTGQTAADGLAVGKASALVYNAVKRLVSGEFTTEDARLAGYQKQLFEKENIYIEPSSAIAFDAARYMGKGIEDSSATTHIMWATGGSLVPADERAAQLKYADVVAALIWRGDRFMICRRPPYKARGLLWEFVGGKVEPGETHEQALIRECREELACEIEPIDVFTAVTHEYPDLTVRLTLYNSQIKSGEPKAIEHTEIRFISPAEIDKYEFCPADEEILKLIKMRAVTEKKNDTACDDILERIKSLAEPGYREFQAKLVPNIPAETILGVRIPLLRTLAKELIAEHKAERFMADLPHAYQEENILHALLINRERDFDRTIKLLDAFLPCVTNWAVCDTLRPAAFTKHKAEVLELIPGWLGSEHIYTVRFGLGMLMAYYLNESFTEEVPMLAAEAANRHEGRDYYIDMMAAWFFATALAKQYDSALPYIAEYRLPAAVHNMTIRKACESFRVTEEHKAELKKYRLNGSETGTNKK